MYKFSTALILILALSNCFFSNKLSIKGKQNINLHEESFSNLKDWEYDDHRIALQTFLHSCRKFSKMPQNTELNGQLFAITPNDYRDVCEIAEVVKTMSSQQIKNFFENWFKLFLVENKKGEESGLFTGYYEVSLKGSFIKSDKYQYPIYSKPKDKKLESELTREDIENGALNDENLEILYVDNKVDLFFLHIQGSGVVLLPNGQEIKISYAGKNNYQFNAISNELIKKDLISKNQINAYSVKNWLENNPQKAQAVMNLNKSYTYFKINQSEYVIGAQGVPLTPERSLAIDNEIIPYGTLMWLETQIIDEVHKKPLKKLMVAQDTGSAIKGTIRGDIFFGNGDKAQDKAFKMNFQGKYYVLLPINFIDRITAR